MDRRSFVIGAGATALAAGSSSRLAAQAASTRTTARLQSEALSPAARAQLTNDLGLHRICRTRPNINSLSAAQLAALKQGITVMQSRPVSDPTSWLYQAGIHGSNLNPQRPQWGTCQHGTLHFLSWHRLYLYYFERILRAASGSSTLMLPFWNWGADRALPAPFRDNSGGNPLFITNRASGMNGGALIPASAVSAAAAMPLTAYSGFTGSIEGTPHGSVHVSVGGWMSSFNTAGQDPIFWLHHCNIDRLWETWLAQGGGRANPTDAGWRDRQFTFFDETGAARTVKASRAAVTCGTLGYNYPRRRLLDLSQILATQISPILADRIRPPRSAVAAPSVALGGRPVEATVALPPRRAGATAQRTYISFDDIDVANPEGYYEIYLNPPPGRTPDFTDPSYAGNLVLFGLTPADRDGMHKGHGAMAEMSARRVFDVTRKIEQLARTKGFDPAKLRVVLILRTPEGGGAARPAVDAPRARIGAIRVISQ